MMLVALYFVGCGSAMLETAPNPFSARFGNEDTAEQRLNFSQIFNPFGTVVGVLIGTQFVFSGVQLTSQQTERMKAAGTYTIYLHREIMRVVPTYVTLALIVLVLAFVLSRKSSPLLKVRSP
jgi:FHS family L-fucose permease-like MFS transporter